MSERGWSIKPLSQYGLMTRNVANSLRDQRVAETIEITHEIEAFEEEGEWRRVNRRGLAMYKWPHDLGAIALGRYQSIGHRIGAAASVSAITARRS